MYILIGNHEQGVISQSSCAARWAKTIQAVVLSTFALQMLGTAAAAPLSLAAEYVPRSWQTEEGLPQNSVRGIVKDRHGYIWAGTESGLVRFDGARFAVFDSRNTPAFSREFIWCMAPKPNRDGAWIGTDGGGVFETTATGVQMVLSASQLPSGIVTALAQDRTGVLWIGTRGGLSRFEHGTVQTWRMADGLAHDFVRSIFEDATGRIWVGTYGGLNYIEQGRVRAAPWKELAKSNVRAICQDRAGKLFFGTNGEGLFESDSNQLRHYTAQEGLGHDVVASLAADAEGALWIATYGGGVTRLKAGRFLALTPEQGLSNAMCLNVYPDEQGHIWIGHNGGGLTCLLSRRVTMLDQRSGLAADIALPILQARNGDVWVGSPTAGVTRFRSGETTRFDTTNGLPRNLVLGLGEDKEGGIWIGTGGGGGVARYYDDRFTTFSSKEGLNDDTVTCILADREGRIWLGTDAGGINTYDGKAFTSLRRAEGLSSEGISCLLESRRGDIWIGTNGGGLDRYRAGKIESVLNDITSLQIFALHEDTEGYLWVGTATGGLVRISDSGQVARVTSAEGLQNNDVLGIVEEQGFLWLSSGHGISRVSKKELMDVCDGKATAVQPLLLGKSDGMTTVECNGGISPSAARLANGEIWFPTTRGVAIVAPAAVKESGPPPPPIIESLTVDEQALPLGPPIRLPASARHFEFACSTPAFRAPERVRFRYRLEGFDVRWSAVTRRHAAYYTRLPAGNYTFRVVSSDENGVWSPAESSVHFSIVPPFYRTKLFYALLACVVGGATLGVHYLRVSRLRRYNAQLQQSVEERTHSLAEANVQLQEAKQEAERANQAKSEFLSRMSHELRTPLNAILGFSQVLATDELTQEQRHDVDLILKGGRHLLALTNEVLDLARIESGDMHLSPEPVRVRELVAETIDLVRPLAIERGIQLKHSQQAACSESTLADRQRLKQVLLNLLSNAIKYNRDAGSVEIECRFAGDRVRIDVQDTGPGIGPENIELLFVPFERLGAEQAGIEGAGLGLALSRRLVEAMGGNVSVQSAIGQGSTFSVELPAADSPVARDEPAAEIKTPPVASTGEKTVLYIEDNLSNLELVVRILSRRPGIKLLSAIQGRLGLDMARQHRPDLIFLDLHLPDLPGHEVLLRLRAEELLRDVPVVVVSADATAGQIARLKAAGANHYLTKPLNVKQFLELLDEILANSDT